jgi:hypothetical protein
MEVPIIGTDSIKWIDLFLSSSLPSSPPFAPHTEHDFAASSSLNQDHHLIWYTLFLSLSPFPKITAMHFQHYSNQIFNFQENSQDSSSCS